MMTVNEVSKLTGVSIRTLQYYDKIGLLHPAEYTKAGYRLYDNGALEKLQQILLFRELEFSLKEIKEILSAPDFDREKALRQQTELLVLREERLEKLIEFSRGLEKIGDDKMDFSAFDKTKVEAYEKAAKEQWGDTSAYKEYENKSAGRTAEKEMALGQGLMAIFAEFGSIKDKDPEGEEAQDKVMKLQAYITDNFYNCTKEILSSLGQMYCAGGEFTENIDKAGGTGTARFTADAIAAYCK